MRSNWQTSGTGTCPPVSVETGLEVRAAQRERPSEASIWVPAPSKNTAVGCGTEKNTVQEPQLLQFGSERSDRGRSYRRRGPRLPPFEKGVR